MSVRAPVLLYVLYPSHFKVMVRVAQLLSESGRYAPIVYFDRGAPFARDLARAAELGVTCIGPDGTELVPATAPSVAHAATSAVTRALGAARALFDHVPTQIRRPLGDAASLWMFVPRLARELVQTTRARRQLRDILHARDIRLVIAPGDNVGYATPALFRSAHDLGIKTMIVPFTVSNRLEMVADLRRHRRFSTARLENALLARLYPHWALEHDGHEMVRAPAEQALAFEWNGLAPADPWVLNSGAVDALAVESEFMQDYYERAGLPADRFRLTGTLGDDAVARVLTSASTKRDALCSELGLDRAKRIVLFSYGEYDYFFQSGRPSEFGSQKDLTEFWASSLLAMPGFEVVLSLHPSIQRERAQHLVERGLHIATQPIEDLIPLCDVYVASISATVRTAIACGKPVVDHDVFDFNYDNFVGLDAVWIAHDKATFATTLERLATDETFYQQAISDQRAVAPRFGNFDGHARERVLAVIDELAGARHGS